MSFLRLQTSNSSRSLNHKRSKSTIDHSTDVDNFSNEPLSDVDLNSPPQSPPGTIRRKLQRKRTSTSFERRGEDSQQEFVFPPRPSDDAKPAKSSDHNRRQSESFRWPTRSGTITFELSPPPSPRSSSPTKDKWGFLASLPGSPTKSDSRPLSALSDWFQGESAPISLGLVSRREDDDDDDEAMDLRPSFLKRSSTLSLGRSRSPAKSQAPSSSGRFGFLTTAAKALSPAVNVSSIPQEDDENDEFLQLDVKAALQPCNGGDPHSASSFSDLLLNAEGLLTRLQSAYQQRVVAVAQARAELSAEKEEKEEIKMKAQHLKQQLNDLSAQNAQKDEIINDLLADLQNEKRLREEDREARARTIRTVDAPQRKHRGGRESVSSSEVSDSGFESNNDDEEIDPYLVSSTTYSSVHSSPRVGHARQTSMTRASPTVVHNQTLSKMDKVETTNPGLGIMTEREAEQSNIIDCTNCQGLKSTAAWGVVGNLRDENVVLKDRNRHLEGELEAVLGMVNGLLGQ